MLESWPSAEQRLYALSSAVPACANNHPRKTSKGLRGE